MNAVRRRDDDELFEVVEEVDGEREGSTVEGVVDFSGVDLTGGELLELVV